MGLNPAALGEPWTALGCWQSRGLLDAVLAVPSGGSGENKLCLAWHLRSRAEGTAWDLEGGGRWRVRGIRKAEATGFVGAEVVVGLGSGGGPGILSSWWRSELGGGSRLHHRLLRRGPQAAHHGVGVVAESHGCELYRGKTEEETAP